MPILAALKEALTFAKEAKTLPVLRERLALAQEQMSVAEKKMQELEAENFDLMRENRDLRKQLEELKKEPDYLDLGLCVLKANPKGGYFDTPLCTSCKKPLSTLIPGKFVCGSCGFSLDSHKVLAEIRKALAS